MRKFVIYLFTGVFALTLLACGAEEKAETFDDLRDKYDGKQFEDCDEFLAAADEIFDVLIATINKAADGDEEALHEIENMDGFMSQFDAQAETFEAECPEKFRAFEQEIEVKMEEAMNKLMEVMFGDMDDMQWEDDYDWEDEDFDWEDEDFDWEEEVEEELDVVM